MKILYCLFLGLFSLNLLAAELDDRTVSIKPILTGTEHDALLLQQKIVDQHYNVLDDQAIDRYLYTYLIQNSKALPYRVSMDIEMTKMQLTQRHVQMSYRITDPKNEIRIFETEEDKLQMQSVVCKIDFGLSQAFRKLENMQVTLYILAADYALVEEYSVRLEDGDV